MLSCGTSGGWIKRRTLIISSTWSVPVYSGTSGEPGYQKGATSSHSARVQPWIGILYLQSPFALRWLLSNSRAVRNTVLASESTIELHRTSPSLKMRVVSACNAMTDSGWTWVVGFSRWM